MVSNLTVRRGPFMGTWSAAWSDGLTPAQDSVRLHDADTRQQPSLHHAAAEVVEGLSYRTQLVSTGSAEAPGGPREGSRECSKRVRT
jgi:hypothetical protein